MPTKAFRHVEAARQEAIYHFRDLGPLLGTDHVLDAQIKAAVQDLEGAAPAACRSSATAIQGTGGRPLW